ncbi:hypothetical protein C7P90_00820 [Staphylococcus aureus]|nr:hypothetical protein [Staphylococcus aureus]PZK55364.1 hypothetical protein C7Q14_00830 [Staphylococcus aureus]PZK76252.1 hypothetical protein C7P73_01565 [Staphylococcus aureus]PZK83934.1 hypothetical protein C7P74_00820 [Staphylococcus aureus]PZL59473.1 hypothetical protein C7P75_08725 [Staphylococcus aureus]
MGKPLFKKGDSMNNSIFYTYLKFNLRYFIRRKFEIVKRSRLNESSPDSCVKCYTMFLPFLLIKIDVFS